jgi:hypothetical protein
MEDVEMSAASDQSGPSGFMHLVGQPGGWGKLSTRIVVTAWLAGSLTAWAVMILAGYGVVKLIH